MARIVGSPSKSFEKPIFDDLLAPTVTCKQTWAETHLLPYRYSDYFLYSKKSSAAWLGSLDKAARTVVWERLNDYYGRALLREGYGMEK